VAKASAAMVNGMRIVFSSLSGFACDGSQSVRSHIGRKAPWQIAVVIPAKGAARAGIHSVTVAQSMSVPQWTPDSLRFTRLRG
jgi:hypothetical protein